MPDSNRRIVHMDLDSFFVSVECLEDSALRGKPVIIGGNSDRGVVASCSYEARHFGVHSAMSSVEAKRLCPQAVWVRGNMEKYSAYSKLITQIISEKAPLFEKSSIDEFYLDISGMDRFWGSYKWATELRQYIQKETGLPISFGLSENKTVSKIATGEAKPNGQINIPHGEEKRFLAPLPVSKIPMAGKKTVEQLTGIGVTDIRSLAEIPLHRMEAMFGKKGYILSQRANGIDNSPVVQYSERKSLSTETTFEKDVSDVQVLKDRLLKMMEELAFDLRKEGFLTGCVTVKIKYSNFDIASRQHKIPFTSSDHVLIEVVQDLLEKLYSKGRPVRLIGARLSNLTHGNYQISLFGDDNKANKLYQAMDAIRKKHGKDSVKRAI